MNNIYIKKKDGLHKLVHISQEAKNKKIKTDSLKKNIQNARKRGETPDVILLPKGYYFINKIKKNEL